MVVHLVQLGAVTLLMIGFLIYPFLPGTYDGLAIYLSTIVQLLGAVGLLLVPIGALWLANDLRKYVTKQPMLRSKDHGYAFAIAALITGSIGVTLVALLVGLSSSVVMGLLVFFLLVFPIYQILPRLRMLKSAEPMRAPVNPVPLYLLVIPLAILLFQIAFSVQLTENSRKHAMANSAEFIRDIEAYHDAYGHYPVSLAAMWKDYDPNVVGIEKYHYSPHGDTYNLFFEQPRFFFDNNGTREWVVYNPQDEHRMYSHTAWLLQLSPEELERSQGWYAVHTGSRPHWKYFWFD